MDVHVIRALNRANRYECGRPWTIYRHRGYTIVASSPNLDFGLSVHPRASLTHIPLRVYIAWKKGVVVGQMVRWNCGSTCRSFRLTEEPLYRLCFRCSGLSVPTVVVNIFS